MVAALGDRLATGLGGCAAAMGDGLKIWAAQVRQQAGTHAGRQADHAGRQADQAGSVRLGPTGPCGLVRLSRG